MTDLNKTKRTVTEWLNDNKWGIFERACWLAGGIFLALVLS